MFYHCRSILVSLCSFTCPVVIDTYNLRKQMKGRRQYNDLVIDSFGFLSLGHSYMRFAVSDYTYVRFGGF